ncbi:transposase domain-containing protein [Streptomyces sp. NPDC057909]|uniref:transposase domain-containing protein n=1 Tax=Streptomyces sp. NPDC057909 TaxID=3346277 RepID=UPI0036EC9DA5
MQRRLRDLPSRVGVYVVLAMCLFPGVGYRLVWQKLITGLIDLDVARPSTKALRDLRRRVGVCSRCWPGRPGRWPSRRHAG